MAVTRALLKGFGLDDEKISAIIEEHTNTINGLKAERDGYKADAEKLKEAQKELEKLKSDGGDWQKKYEDEHKAYEDYKAEISSKQQREQVKQAYIDMPDIAGDLIVQYIHDG